MKTTLTLGTLLTMISLHAKMHIVTTMNSNNGKSMVFNPTYIKIAVGDEIKFVPKSKGHTSKSLFVPEGATTWAGKDSKEITVKFTKEGLYLYDCKNHGVMGMIGLIEVGEAKNKEEVVDYYMKHKTKIVMNKNRLDEYLINN